jgi:hypothetical protein
MPPGGDPLTAVRSAGAALPGRLAGLHPLLFAAYAVLFLWSQNLGETTLIPVIFALIAVVVGAAVLTLIASLILRDRRRGALVATPVVIGLLMYGHAANLAKGIHLPGTIQQLAWVLVIVLAIVAAIRLPERQILRLDTVLSGISTILVAVTLVLIVPFLVTTPASRGSTDRSEPAASTTSADKRDVYWLVFDRYGSDRALELQYGVDNDLTGWLEAQGFTVLPDSHANYIRTVLSMSSTLQMSTLDELAKVQGPSSQDVRPANELLQDSLVARQFKALGYRYVHIGSWWDPTHADPAADVELTASPVLRAGDFADALYDVSALPILARRLGIAPQNLRERHYMYGLAGLDALSALRDEPGPKFVLAHILLPHPPHVFDRDGSFITGSESRALGRDELYRRQLDYTNSRVREIVSGLLSLPEGDRPIVIFQADEGPWPPSYSKARKTSSDWAAGATEQELEQKYGIMNAWYLPGGEDLGLYPTMTAINTFPVLFSRYFGIAYPLLPDRIYSSHDWFHPYDLTEITDRLPSLR